MPPHLPPGVRSHLAVLMDRSGVLASDILRSFKPARNSWRTIQVGGVHSTYTQRGALSLKNATCLQ